MLLIMDKVYLLGVEDRSRLVQFCVTSIPFHGPQNSSGRTGGLVGLAEH